MGADISTTYTSRSESNYDKSYDQQYSGQTAGRDDDNNVTYDRYSQSYAYETASGRDGYGNPTYGDND